MKPILRLRRVTEGPYMVMTSRMMTTSNEDLTTKKTHDIDFSSFINLFT